MTTTPESTKGVPRIEGDSAPTLRADHNALADWVRDNIGTQVANEAALAGLAFAWPGRIVTASDTDIEYRYTGSGWRKWNSPWLTWTPTYTNFTVGAGGFARYRYVSGLVSVWFRLPIASMGADPRMTLPVNASNATLAHLTKGIVFIPPSGSETVGIARRISASQVVFYYLFASPALVIANISATAPFTWGTTISFIDGQFDYDPA